MIRRSYLAFLLLTLAWLAAGTRIYGRYYGFDLATAIVWWGLLVMLVAAGYYVVQEAPAARVSGWLKRDLAVNTALFVALLYAILDGVNGYRWLGLRGAGWIAFGAALLHPVLVDRPHQRHHRDDPAGSPVPQYVPPACLWIDWTLAALVLVGMLLV